MVVAPGIDVAKIAVIGETVIIHREGPESSVLAGAVAVVAAVAAVVIIRAAADSKIMEEVVVRTVANAVALGTVLGEPVQRIRKSNCRRACVTKSL